MTLEDLARFLLRYRARFCFGPAGCLPYTRQVFRPGKGNRVAGKGRQLAVLPRAKFLHLPAF